jgi:3',5'-nucleoside bisphosphate phosphatase
MIDLHTHSTFSDGSLTPEALVEQADAMGLSALALTDHDCTDGHTRFLAACSGRGVRGIPGVEISAEVPKGTLHMLGFFLDGANGQLRATLDEIRDGRKLRNGRILDRLNGLGMNLSWEEVAAFAGEDTVGRPHFAQAMVAKGYVASKEEAFDRYLGKGQAAYVDRFRLSPEDSIAAIRAAGGVAVLAHPFTMGLGPKALREAAIKLKDAGLGGIEAYYSEHSASQHAQYMKLAKDIGLAVSGGSDFHGDLNPAIKLGVGFGNLRVPDELLAGLEKLAGPV